MVRSLGVVSLDGRLWLRFSVSILGTEVFALHVGSDAADGPDGVRYDPMSTTACQTETAFADQSVVLCESPFGFRADRV